MKKLIRLFLVIGLSLFWLPSAFAACDEVRFRLWQKDAETQWFDAGEAVEIEPGAEGHVYVHVDGKAQGRSSHYSTRTEIGYPQTVGLEKSGNRIADISRHLRVTPQNAADRDAGRMRLEAVEAGETQLGYRIEDVKSPGRLDMVPAACRAGVIPFRIAAADDGYDDGYDDGHDDGYGDDQDHDGEGSSSAAAKALAEELMQGFLRRDNVSDLDPSFVNQIERGGRDGILEVAATIVASREFREEALRRADEVHGDDHRATLAELRELLLEGIYRDFYGYGEPSRDEREADLRDLETCLQGRSEACERLGREIISRRPFYDEHRELLDQL